MKDSISPERLRSLLNALQWELKDIAIEGPHQRDGAGANWDASARPIANPPQTSVSAAQDRIDDLQQQFPQVDWG